VVAAVVDAGVVETGGVGVLLHAPVSIAPNAATHRCLPETIEETLLVIIPMN
jgi:hypothetical protein